MKKTVYFLLLCFTAFLFSCLEDDLNKSHDHNNHAEHKMRMKKVSFHDMKSYLLKHTNSTLPASLDPSFNKGGDAFITAIDTTNISQITSGDVTTFTLYVNTLDDELYAYSNLVIKLHNGQTEESILHYNPTQEWQAAYNSGERLPYDGDLTITDIYGEEIERAVAGGTCMLEITLACYGASCPCTDGNGQVFYVTISCGGGGGDGDNPTDPIPGGFDPMDGGSGISYSRLMNDYFGIGNWIEINNPPIDLPGFDDLIDAWDYIYGESFEGEGGELVNINNSINDRRVTHYKVKFWNVVGERGVRMYVTQTRNDENENPRPVIISITSQWYGGSFYNNWNQHENYDIENLAGFSDSKRITIYGTKTSGFEYDGHGFFVNTEYKIQFIINKEGVISNVYWWNVD